MTNGRFDQSQIVCPKTLYRYIDLGLFDIKNADLPMKLCRKLKSTTVKKHKKNLGTSISDYTIEYIAFIEDWMNTLPRRILNYKTPEELFELHLD